MADPMARLEAQLVATLRETLNRRPAAIPDAGAWLWNAFAALSATRSHHMAGPNPIAYAEIEAWSRLTRTPLEPHHVEVLRELDETWLAHFTKETRSGKTPARSSGQSITPAAFDAVFG